MTTIPTEAERAAERARKMKRVGDLERGDWFRPDFADFVSAACVRHVEPYRSDAWGNGVVLLYRPVGEQGADSHRLSADDQVPMLTEDEIDQAMDVDRRELIAEQLADVIRLVRDPAFPLPATWQAVQVEFKYADPTTVARFAKLLGVDQQATDLQVHARRDGEDSWCAGVDVVGSAFKKPDPDPTDQLYSREADDSTPLGAREPLHTGGMTDGGLVDETGCTHGVTTCRCADADEAPAVECSPACRDLYRPDRGVHFLGCPNFATPMAADIVPVPAEDATVTQLPGAGPRTELLAIVPTADGMVAALAPVGAVTDPIRRAHVVELTEAAAEQLDAERAQELAKAHFEALDEDNQRAKRAVELSMTAADEGRIANPGLARFLAVKEDAKRFPTHLVFLLGDTACGIEPEEIPATDRQTSDADAATCRACRRSLKPSAKDLWA